MTTPSQPAYLSMAENRPPKLDRVNHSIGEDCTPMPWTSVRLEAPGARVPESGEVMRVTMLAGSKPPMVLSLTRSKKSADPSPCPPTHSW